MRFLKRAGLFGLGLVLASCGPPSERASGPAFERLESGRKAVLYGEKGDALVKFYNGELVMVDSGLPLTVVSDEAPESENPGFREVQVRLDEGRPALVRRMHLRPTR